MTKEDEEAGRVPEGSPMHRNMQALAEENRALREVVSGLSAEMRVLQNKVTMIETMQIPQLQNLFATQMVARGSGPTTG